MTAEREQFEKLTHAICERRGWKCDGHKIDLDLDDGRHQEVHLDFFEYDDREMVRIYSLIGPTKRIKLERLVFALEMSFRMPYGSMAVHDETLVVVDTHIVADADTEGIESTIAYMAETADQYEKSMFGPDAY